MNIGPYTLHGRAVLAPMAGVTDRPFRQMCKQFGAAMAVAEMVTSDVRLWDTEKTRRRMDYQGEVDPIAVQIVGTDPGVMANAAQRAVEHGAQIIDINMGCPAKKVCSVAAGSALLKNEQLVAQILHAVVAAVSVPVTLKVRTGWDSQHKNGVQIAHIAELEGIQALAVHGRTRNCGYTGIAEYDTIAEIKSRAGIPIIANGDITDAVKARDVLDYTKADAVMIGRAAQGRPWIFQEINHFLATNALLSPPSGAQISQWLQTHLVNLYDFYGEFMGVKIARKHISWYCKAQSGSGEFRKQINQVENAVQQLEGVREFFLRQSEDGEKAA